MMIIYKTTNLINGKIYIGQDSKNNPNYLGSGKIIKLAIEKYGKENFLKEILEVCETKESLNESEIYWIKYYNSKIPNGYNIIDGGGGMLNPPDDVRYEMGKSNRGKHHSEETKRKIGESQIGKFVSEETRKKLSVAANGRKHTEETKKKMSDSQKVRESATDETRKKMSESAKGKIISEATRKKLSVAAKGRKPWITGKHHTDESREKMSESAKCRKSSDETKKKISESMKGIETHYVKKVYQYDLDGNFIAEFLSVKEAKEKTRASHISMCCNKIKKYKTSGGFRWSFSKMNKLDF